jgi:hypothetical protein
VLTNACGARTLPLEDDAPRDASVDRRMDTSRPVSCEIATVSSPIVTPPTCASSFDACRPVVESALLVPAACGQLPRAAWSGEALIVGWDGVVPGAGDGVSVAAVGLDGGLRQHIQLLERQRDGQRPSMAFGDSGVGIVAGVDGLAWLDARGNAIGAPVELDRTSGAQSVLVVRERFDTFRLLKIDALDSYLASVSDRPEMPEWTLFGGGDIRGALFMADAAGFGHTAALLGRNPREIQYYGLAGGLSLQRLSWDITSLQAGLTVGGRRFTIHGTADSAAAEGPGFYLVEEDVPEATHVANEGTPWGADFLLLEATVVVALPLREDGARAIGISAVATSAFPLEVEPPRFVAGAGGSATTPDLVRLPNGFALVYEEDAGIFVDVFECCL